MSVSISASSFPFLSSVDASTKPIVAVKIIPAPMSSSRRRRFHLAMLLDVSGSMDGERIEALRRTLNLLVDALAEGDILTLITYNSAASVRADCVVIAPDTRTTLHATVDSLVADGGTNMEAAIGSLLVLAADPAKPNVDAVFILTDGHINAGMTSSAGLLRLLQHQMNQGVPINTLGYGADHNSRLLRDMALRSNGSYTFADADEVLPAIIGDIMGGLEAEVGRQGKLHIPTGWNCLELQTVDSGGAYCVGTLIAEKLQWIVLEGEAGATSIPPLVFSWKDPSGVEQSQTIILGTDIPMLEIVEQRERCRVATCFAAVTEDVEHFHIDEARAKLGELAAQLTASPAKDTVFVIRLQAQVDDMLESLKPLEMPPASPGGGGLARSPAGWFGGSPGPAPSVAPVMSRLASNTTVLVNQRGFMSAAARQQQHIAPALFSSPSQRSASNRLAAAYSQTQTAATELPIAPTEPPVVEPVETISESEVDSSDSA